MNKTSTATDLWKIGEQVQNCLSIYSRELRRRDTSDGQATLGLAPNTDVIYEYIYPRFARDFATPAIEALRQTKWIRTLLLPGVQEELCRLYEVQRHLPEESFYRDVRHVGPSSEKEKEHILRKLRMSLNDYYGRLTTAKFAMDRLSAFLSSQNINPTNWADVDPKIFEPTKRRCEGALYPVVRK